AICDGDWVVVRQQPNANNGEIVAAMLDGEATVKPYRTRDGHVWLMPQNPAFDPIAGGDATILGRVVTVVRRICPLRRRGSTWARPTARPAPVAHAPRCRPRGSTLAPAPSPGQCPRPA